MSKKTIYLEDAINVLHNEIVKRRISEDVNDDGSLDEFDTESILRRLPSAQPELIRCKDCKYNGECSIQFVANVGDKFFCGAGERRQDGNQ